MAKLFVISTAGKEDINRANMAMNFAYNAVKNAGATVAFMFLGRGVETLLKDSGGSKPMLDMINNMKELNIDVMYCKVSLKGLGLNPEIIFDGIRDVMGGVETAKRVDEGYSVITF
ncbi:DsrE family protein [Acidiplasma aeolicum]|jgi:tRNA 2-thiouridine synthesizing protein D|uniref:DsrE family protein n=1 Tax=Acidiplasma aeolicum TaxID=507754 RepID=UPI00371E40DF